MKHTNVVLFFCFLSALQPQQQIEANTTNDEPLTEKERNLRQSVDGIAAFVGDKTILKSDRNQPLCGLAY